MILGVMLLAVPQALCAWLRLAASDQGVATIVLWEGCGLWTFVCAFYLTIISCASNASFCDSSVH